MCERWILVFAFFVIRVVFLFFKMDITLRECVKRISLNAHIFLTVRDIVHLFVQGYQAKVVIRCSCDSLRQKPVQKTIKHILKCFQWNVWMFWITAKNTKNILPVQFIINSSKYAEILQRKIIPFSKLLTENFNMTLSHIRIQNCSKLSCIKGKLIFFIDLKIHQS